MVQFMADITLPDNPAPEFFALIPLQRLQVGILFKSGRLSSYALSLDRKKLWAVFNGNSLDEIQNIIDIFPLRAFMQVTIQELAFVEEPIFQFPTFSLN
ncbi:MAG: hypothetical protein IPM69_12590 [Ignavibacteria bacterium]|nr:hypothetical protein [Ignavibacteria bacterium]